MAQEFKYDETELEDGNYLLRITRSGTFGSKIELFAAEYVMGNWYLQGIDYDVLRFNDTYKDARIEVVCKLDLQAIADAADKQE